MRGKMIVFEGIDGSGKGTQSRLLTDVLLARSMAVKHMSFPAYRETFFGREVGNFLDGQFGDLDAVHPKLAAILFAGDRFEMRDDILTALDCGTSLVIDRYVSSNIAHQSAKLPETERDEFARWVDRLEYEIYGLPRPDLTIFLDVPPNISTGLIEKKERRDYTEKKHDIQEADNTYLQSVYRVYESLCRASGWQRVRCAGPDGVRPTGEIHHDVLFAVEKFLAH